MARLNALGKVYYLSTLETISVLIPSYNASKYIRKVVEYIIEQTLPASEIIVVDDASTDKSVEIVKQLPVKLICHEKNMGPANTRNTGLHAAKGDIVVFIDSDAYADPNMLSTFNSRI